MQMAGGRKILARSALWHSTAGREQVCLLQFTDLVADEPNRSHAGTLEQVAD